MTKHKTMRRFFIESEVAVGADAAIAGQDARHIRSVLRLKPHDEILLVDGVGHEFIARILSLESHQVMVSILEKSISQTESPIQLTVALGMLKEKKMDGLIRQLTELGMRRFLPYFAERSIPKLSPHRIEERVKRWERIAQESIKQCRRGTVPEISAPTDLKSVLALAKDLDVRIVFWENATQCLSCGAQSQGKKVVQTAMVLLGPEGGLSEKEIEQIIAAGFNVYSMGPRILRAETAAVTACALVQFLLGDMGHA